MHKGKVLEEDLKTLKDIGVRTDSPSQIMVSQKNEFELDMQL